MLVPFDDMDVFVFQMGKVASSAITGALQGRGVNAVQMHWLGRKTLVGTLEQSLLNVDGEAPIELNGIEEFEQNIRNTRALYWYRKHKRRDGEKLGIITLARDPLDWYWGHLAENFDFYETEIRDWYARVADLAPGSVDIAEASRVFHEALFNGFGSIRRSIDHPRFDEKAAKQVYKGVSVPFLPQQIMKLRLPTAWFDVFFRPEIGIDVFQKPLDANTGMAEFENDFARVLLVRYENLENCVDAIGNFAGAEGLSLDRVNASGDKRTPVDLGALRSEIRPDPKALEKLYGSRYCRHFGYTGKSA